MKKRKKNEKLLNPKKIKTMDDYVKFLIDSKQIDKKDFSPLKCKHCGSKKLKQDKTFYEDFWGGLVVSEYEVVCKSCGESAGYWSYGSWNVF